MTDPYVPSDSAYRPRDIVESFLQTAVVLDDLVVISPASAGQEGAAPVRPIVIPDFPETLAASDDDASQYRSGVRLNADIVINAFADIGMVCAVLKAAPGGEFEKRTAKAAVRADMVVLDWKIHDSAGDVALSVMRNILADDQNNNRLRLIAIYTGEPDLRGIYERIQVAIEDFYEGEELEADCPSRITKGPVRVVILAKEGTFNSHSSSPGHQEVTERELAGRLADEFVSMTSGLLRNVALAGIATIRNNTHRILASFDQNLDPAYLGHRLLLSNPPDAEDHLVSALGSELLSVLEEDRPGAHANIDAIERWLKGVNGPNVSKPFPFSEKANAVNSLLNWLQRGIKGETQLPTGKKTLKKRGTEIFAADAAAAIPFQSALRCIAQPEDQLSRASSTIDSRGHFIYNKRQRLQVLTLSPTKVRQHPS